MLRALQADEMSAVYENKFFQNVDRVYTPPHVSVRLCEDREYRTICPFQESGMSASFTTTVFLVATVAGVLTLMGFCAAIWTLDRDTKEAGGAEMVDDGSTLALQPELEAEFARSWLENRHQLSAAKVKQEANKRAVKAMRAQK